MNELIIKSTKEVTGSDVLGMYYFGYDSRVDWDERIVMFYKI